MSNNYLKNQNKITARRWYTDMDLNITPHPSSGDLVLKQDKEAVKNQIKNWSLETVENLIYDTNEIELLVKKNSINSLNILSDFIMLKSNKLNN